MYILIIVAELLIDLFYFLFKLMYQVLDKTSLIKIITIFRIHLACLIMVQHIKHEARFDNFHTGVCNGCDSNL